MVICSCTFNFIWPLFYTNVPAIFVFCVCISSSTDHIQAAAIEAHHRKTAPSASDCAVWKIVRKTMLSSFFLMWAAFFFKQFNDAVANIDANSGIKVEAICETCNTKSNMASEDRSRNMQKIASFLAYERDIHDSFGGRVRHATSGRFLISSYIVRRVSHIFSPYAF